eukprot:UN03696
MGECGTKLQPENSYCNINKPQPCAEILSTIRSASESDHYIQPQRQQKRALSLTSTEFNKQLRRISYRRRSEPQIDQYEMYDRNVDINDYKLESNPNLYRVKSKHNLNVSNMKQHNPQIDDTTEYSNSGSYNYKMVY